MTPPRNSNAARDIANVLHPYTDHRAHAVNGPLVIARGEGVRVWDDQGKEYIEAVAGLWCASLGFDNKRLAEAAYTQMKKLPFYHSFTAKSHEPLIDLSEMLIERAPCPMSKVFYANSGSEANDTALKMVWYYNNAVGRPEKKKVISRLKAYHGITIAAGSLTGLPVNHKMFDLPVSDRFIHVSTPHHYHGAKPGESEEDFATRLAAELEETIVREGPETVAAFFAEPVMGAGGVMVPPATYFEKIQAVLRRHDVLFVADEVICGFGRTGNYWGCQTYDITPDIITCAKALSASFLPISAIIINDRIFQGLADGSQTIGTWGHGFTYSGHPVAAAVALETLKIYDELDIVSHVRSAGDHMQKALRARFEGHPLVGEVRGIGMVAAIELVADKANHKNFEASAKVGPRLAKAGEQEGVILRGLANDTIAFSPPLIMNVDEIDQMVERTARALDNVAVQLRRESLTVV
ncbi:aspartate aminotransferase family protein [Falsiroseomonas sp. E2-1-a20]|uniref:aspartate aminotransferase family protein n=1 Tax=Falsiroseomonas sp. E2-1-a20 TaxID=3239300 RepID=UPI003F2D814D